MSDWLTVPLALARIAGGFIPLGSYIALKSDHGSFRLGRRYTACADNFRIREGALHRCFAAAQLSPDGTVRWIGRRGRTLDCKSDFMSRCCWG
jgi:hypothetical protein